MRISTLAKGVNIIFILFTASNFGHSWQFGNLLNSIIASRLNNNLGVEGVNQPRLNRIEQPIGKSHLRRSDITRRVTKQGRSNVQIYKAELRSLVNGQPGAGLSPNSKAELDESFADPFISRSSIAKYREELGDNLFNRKRHFSQTIPYAPAFINDTKSEEFNYKLDLRRKSQKIDSNFGKLLIEQPKETLVLNGNTNPMVEAKNFPTLPIALLPELPKIIAAKRHEDILNILGEITFENLYSPYKSPKFKRIFPFTAYDAPTQDYHSSLARTLVITTASLIQRTQPVNLNEFLNEISERDDIRTFLNRKIWCPFPIPEFACKPEQYRSFSGFCNNPLAPALGAAYLPMRRILNPTYVDGINTERQSVAFSPLPRPDLLSRNLLLSQNLRARLDLNSLFYQYSQFILADILQEPPLNNNEKVDCCGGDPKCFIYSQKLANCSNLSRTPPALSLGCLLGARQQINTATSYIDGSVIYGSTDESVRLIRTFEGGKIKEREIPKDNTVLSLGALSKTFNDYHNIIANKLKILNLHWDDDTLFQESRKIVGAVIQQITYKEWLPYLVGPSLMESNGLILLCEGENFEEYDLGLEPTTANVISTAIYPWFYKLLPQNAGPENQNRSLLSISELLNTPIAVRSQGPNDWGKLGKNSFESSNLEAFEFYLYKGRDHGTPGYLSWRRWCKILPEKIDNFAHLELVFGSENIAVLKTLYKHVEDIDLFVGIWLENFGKDGLMGPTAACLLSEQFMRLRRADRFWFESTIEPNKFSIRQIDAIREISLSSVFCEISNSSVIQKDIFRVPHILNNINISCHHLPKLNLSQWIQLDSEGQILNKNLDVNKILLYTQVGANNAHLDDNVEMESYKNEALKSKINSGKNEENLPAAALSQIAHILINTTGLMAEKFKLGRKDLEFLSIIPVPKFIIFPTLDQCDPAVESTCDYEAEYRTINGRCSDLRFPNLGKSAVELTRLLPANYEDSVNKPVSKNLPGPFLAGQTLIYGGLYRAATILTMNSFIIAWAAFIDFETARIPLSIGYLGSSLNCTACDSQSRVSVNCMPIHMSENWCLNYIRSSSGNRNFGPRNQLNLNTAFLDGSAVYGSDHCSQRHLRLYKEGLIKTDALKTPEKFAPSSASNDTDILGRDEIIGLLSREHNRLAMQLFKFNPHWNDEKLYQESRKIVGALIQHITYNEFLPAILGPYNINKFNLGIGVQKVNNGVKSVSNCDPGIINSFTSAAWPLVHQLFKERNLLARELKLMKPFVNITFTPNKEILTSIVNRIVNTITYLIQRGRDHGLPSYLEFKQWCNITGPAQGSPYERHIKDNAISVILQRLYPEVSNIDLVVGLVAEGEEYGSILGPTANCLIGTQFQRLKECDRFWYENMKTTNGPGFRADQLREVRKISLAKLLCNDNQNPLREIRRNLFDNSDPLTNPEMPCKLLGTSINLNIWSDSGSCYEKGTEVHKGNYLKTSPCTLCYCPFYGDQASCNDIKIENCFQLFVEHAYEDVIKDESCVIQCSYVFKSHAPAQQLPTATSLNVTFKPYYDQRGQSNYENADKFNIEEQNVNSVSPALDLTLQNKVIISGKYGLNIKQLRLP